MKILIFSNRRDIKELFASVGKSEKYSFSYHTCSEIESMLPTLSSDTFIYLDIDDYDASARRKMLKKLSRKKLFRMKEHGYGIIDPQSIIEDPATLFHNGASDYIGREVYEKGIDRERLGKAVSYGRTQPHIPSPTIPKKEKAPKGKPTLASPSIDWTRIKPGQEYLFSLMYVELDDQNELKGHLGDSKINLIKTSFREFIKKKVEPHGGRIWMWQDFGGLILFPFDGVECDAVLACFRLILFRKIYNVEESRFHTMLSYHIALHLNSVVYTYDRDTSTVISDSVNTIFNIGKKHVPSGNLYVTEDALHYAPEKLKACFMPAGRFEGREVERMRLPY